MAVLQQVMLAVVVLVITAFAIIAAIPGDLTLFFVGVAMVFVMTIVTMLVPWNAISPWAVGIVPVIDVVAILFMRAAFPESGIALLWLFPVMWLSASLGLAGFLAANLFVWVSYGWVIAAGKESAFSFALILLPIVTLAVSAGAYFSLRRFAAQRTLLDKQALVLGQSLERTQHQEQLVTQVLDSVDFGVQAGFGEGSEDWGVCVGVRPRPRQAELLKYQHFLLRIFHEAHLSQFLVHTVKILVTQSREELQQLPQSQ